MKTLIFPLKLRNLHYKNWYRNSHKILPQEVFPGAGGKKGMGSMHKLADRSFLLASFKPRDPACSRSTWGTASPESLLPGFEQWHKKAVHHSHHKKKEASRSQQLPSGNFTSALEWFPTYSGSLSERWSASGGSRIIAFMRSSALQTTTTPTSHMS